jgi:hypothetical protein
MINTRRDFIRLTVLAVGGGALASSLEGCGASSSPDGGAGGGSSGGGTGGGSTGGGTGGSSGGGTGGGTTGGGTGGGTTGGGTGGGTTGGGGGTGGSSGGGGGATGGGGGAAGGGGGGGGSAVSCANNGAHDTNITLNHGHSLMVPAADFSAVGDKVYDIMGGSLHSHSITLTAAQRATILGGGSVTVTSTLTGHTHDVTVACA